MGLKDVFCQAGAIDTLQKAYACGRVPHAYIFAGRDGVGRFKTAWEWAKLLLCMSPVVEGEFSDSCGGCASCAAFEGGGHPDFVHIYKELREFTKDGKGKAAPIDLPKDVVVEFLIDKISARPGLSERRVFVVSEAEKLNKSSQNALLKSLEEPPEFCSIILLCTRLEKLLPTTKSRCQTIRFGLIDEQRIAAKLLELGVGADRCEFFAGFSAGSIGQACSWAELEQAEAGIYEAKKGVVEALARFSYGDSVDLASQWLAAGKRISGVWAKAQPGVSKSDIGRRCQKLLLETAISAFNDAMKLGIGGVVKIVNCDQKTAIEAIAGRFDAEQCAEKIAQCYESISRVEASVNDKLIFEQLLLNLSGAAIIQR